MLMYQNKIFFRVGLVVGMAFFNSVGPNSGLSAGCRSYRNERMPNVGGIETSIEIIYSKWVSTVQSIFSGGICIVPISQVLFPTPQTSDSELVGPSQTLVDHHPGRPNEVEVGCLKL